MAESLEALAGRMVAIVIVPAGIVYVIFGSLIWLACPPETGRGWSLLAALFWPLTVVWGAWHLYRHVTTDD